MNHEASCLIVSERMLSTSGSFLRKSPRKGKLGRLILAKEAKMNSPYIIA